MGWKGAEKDSNNGGGSRSWPAEQERALRACWAAACYRIDEVAAMVTAADPAQPRQPEACRTKATKLGLGPLPRLPSRKRGTASDVGFRGRVEKDPVPPPEAYLPRIVAAPQPIRRLEQAPPVRYRECQWVEGDPRGGDWHYCGAPRADGTRFPFCAAHLARAVVPPSSRTMNPDTAEAA